MRRLAKSGRTLRVSTAFANKAELRRALKEGAIRNADRDRQIAAEWDHLSAEAWAHLDCADRKTEEARGSHTAANRRRR